jgi:hypothetical protein
MGEKVKREKGEGEGNALLAFRLFPYFPDRMTSEFEKVILRKL